LVAGARLLSSAVIVHAVEQTVLIVVQAVGAVGLGVRDALTTPELSDEADTDGVPLHLAAVGVRVAYARFDLPVEAAGGVMGCAAAVSGAASNVLGAVAVFTVDISVIIVVRTVVARLGLGEAVGRAVTVRVEAVGSPVAVVVSSV
jgi:hypothetical protein